MADDQKQPTRDEAKTESGSAKDSAQEAQKAEDKAEQAADQAQQAAKEAEISKEKAQAASKAVEIVAEESEEKSEQSRAQVKVSKKLEDIISEIEKLSVLELSELVKALEAKFGVSAAAPMATAAAGAPAGSEEGASEQTTFNVILSDGGANKISVIKAVREIVPTLGLKEAKDLVDSAPKPVLEGANKETANEAKTKLEAAGAKVELK